MISDLFKQNLQFGLEGEHDVSLYLKEKGICIFPLYQFGTIDHAPFIIFNDEKINSTDLICFEKDLTYFGEVKTKNQWIKYNGNVRTGFDQKQFEHYKRLKEITSMPVFIFFNMLKEQPTGIFKIELDNYEYMWDGYSGSIKKCAPIVLYNYTQLIKI